MSSKNSVNLQSEGYDAQQIEMMSENVILVDVNDSVLGSMSKLDAHQGEGTLHRAFSILLFDENNRLLVQRRAGHKITFPDVWANTVCSHPLYVDDEIKSDGVGSKYAAIRKMEQEMGIPIESISIDDIHFITRMLYKARADDVWVEYELDHILFARVSSDLIINPNSNEISEIDWVNQQQLDDWLSGRGMSDRIIAPWFRCIAENILPEYWGNLDSLSSLKDDLIRDMGDVSHMIEKSENVPGQALMTALKSHKEAVENRIIAALSKSNNERLRAAMMHLIEGGGKRLRAILPWLVADALGGSHDGLYDLGASIEIIHNFTLVHDDIMDNDSIRRGRPAVHVEFDHPTAINAGDAMLAVAFEVLADSNDFDAEHFRDLVSIIGSMVRMVSEGQQQDMSFENRDDVTQDEYIQMISGKTAAMFTTCARSGALLSGADSTTVDTLALWGEYVGLCFQLMDDLIDVTGDSKTLGKPACSDIIEGKQTLIAIHALQQDESKLTTFHEVFGSGIEDTDQIVLDQVISELHESDSISHARNLAMEYHRKAHECLDSLPESAGLVVLRDITDFQLIRIS